MNMNECISHFCGSGFALPVADLLLSIYHPSNLRRIASNLQIQRTSRVEQTNHKTLKAKNRTPFLEYFSAQKR